MRCKKDRAKPRSLAIGQLLRQNTPLTPRPLLAFWVKASKPYEGAGLHRGSRNKSKIARHEAAAETVALIGELIPDAFAGDAHAFLVPRTVTRNGVRFGDRYT